MYVNNVRIYNRTQETLPIDGTLVDAQVMVLNKYKLLLLCKLQQLQYL